MRLYCGKRNIQFPGSTLLLRWRRRTASWLDRLKYCFDMLVLRACAKRQSAEIDGAVVAQTGMRKLIKLAIFDAEFPWLVQRPTIAANAYLTTAQRYLPPLPPSL